MSAPTFTKTGSKSPTSATLDKQVFSFKVNDYELLKQAYVGAQANARTNLAHTKTRGEVRGGGRKPWRQKGTGRARFGSIRNPIWRGGGIAFGPRTGVNHSLKLNAKSRRTALKQALSLANADKRLSVIEAISPTDKTNELAKLLDKVGFSRGLLVVEQADTKLRRAAGNLPGIELLAAAKLSAADVLDAPALLMDKPAVAAITARLKG